MSCLRTSVLLCLVLVTGGALSFEPLRVVIIDPPDKITVCIEQPVRFEAVAYTSDGVGFISSPEWVWEFGDGEKTEKNPTEHAYGKEGTYTVTVTATAKEGTGTAETTVEVVGDGGNLLLGGSLYLRDPVTKAVIGADGVCDLVEVVFETTDMVNATPALLRQPPPLVPPDTWESLGPGTYENTGIPGLKRWWWGWMTWDQRNWPVNFKVIYYRPGTPPPMPPPAQQVTVGPVTWTPNNTAVHSDDVILPWNGEDPLTIPWTITHANRNNPTFTVTVSIYVIDATTPTKTFTLTNQSIGAGSVEWNGEVNQGQPPAQPGVYTYRVTAVHNALPICQDTDKSGLLTPSVTELWQINRNTQADTVKVMAEYALNRDAGGARIEMWGADSTSGEYPVELGELDCTDLATGTHLTSSAVIPVELDANGELTHPLHAVIYATETSEDGEANRDLLPKFAVQRNDDTPIKPQVSCVALGYSSDHKMFIWDYGEPKHDQPIDPDDTHFLWPPDEDEDDCPAEACYTKGLPVTMFGRFTVTNVPDAGLTGVSVHARVGETVIGEKGGLTAVDGKLHDGGSEVVNGIGPGSPVPGGDHVCAMELAPTWQFRIDGGDWETATGGGSVTAFWTHSTPIAGGGADLLYDLGLVKACGYVEQYLELEEEQLPRDARPDQLALAVAKGVSNELVYLMGNDRVRDHHPFLAYEPGYEGVECGTHATVMRFLMRHIGIPARQIIVWGGCGPTTDCTWRQGTANVSIRLVAPEEDFIPANPHFELHVQVDLQGDGDPVGDLYDPTYGELPTVDESEGELAPAGEILTTGATHAAAAHVQRSETMYGGYHRLRDWHCGHP